MTVIDDRGRLFGRVNLVDAALIAVLFGLVPLAYGGYALFRTKPPRLTSVDPKTIAIGPTARVTVHGENLRPYMRVSFGDYQGRSFLFENPTTAEIEMNDMPPGTYDVVLYDYAQERARLPKALTVTRSTLPSTSVLVIGRVANVTEDVARKIVAGLPVAGFGPVLEAGRPVPQVTRIHSAANVVDAPVPGAFQVPIRISVPCAVQMFGDQPSCVTNAAPLVTLVPDAFLELATPIGPFKMQVDQVLGSEPVVPIDAVVRFVASPSALALVRPGDVDVGVSRNELAAGARVEAVSADLGLSPEFGGVKGLGWRARDVALRLSAQKGVDGWKYQGSALRAGTTFVLRTAAYELQGLVQSVTPPPTR